MVSSSYPNICVYSFSSVCAGVVTAPLPLHDLAMCRTAPVPGAGHVIITTQRSRRAQSPDDHDQGRTTSLNPQFSHSAFQYLLLLGLVSAAPRPDSPPVYVPAPAEPYKAAPPPPRAYKPAPAPYKEEELPPQPYEYKYGVADDYSKSTFDKAETQDEYGNVQGSYKV